MARFFASSSRASSESSAAARGAATSTTASDAKNNANTSSASRSNINNKLDSSSSSTAGENNPRWSRRPRLRRQHAHDFDHALEKSTVPAPALSRESLGSGYTEAPSSRGASETLSACSPSAAGLEDFLGDVSDDDFSWLEAELPPSVAEPSTSQVVEDSTALSETDSYSAASRREGKIKSKACSPAPAPAPRYLAPLELKVEDFECGECIGKGSYSRVFLGTHVVSGTEWALKVVSKRKTFETRENLAHLREEKNITSKLQGSDFLVRTAGTFQNPRSVVFAMEYLPGGDLYQRLADKGTLPLGEAVAWVAQAVLAIEDLHALRIAHRDVKPENFLMGKSGTLKLTDFGFARQLAKGERLFSQFGTPEYVAPEVLNGCGHGMAVDLWALGVLIYELLVGHTPFKAGSVDEMYERIAAGDYAFPAPPARKSPSASKSNQHKSVVDGNAGACGGTGGVSRSSSKRVSHKEAFLLEEEEDGAQDPAAQSLVKSLLRLAPGRRPSIADIKAHPFFDGVDFDALRAAVRAQADADEEEAVVAAAINGGDVWLRDQPVVCLSEDIDDNYGGVFAGF